MNIKKLTAKKVSDSRCRVKDMAIRHKKGIDTRSSVIVKNFFKDHPELQSVLDMNDDIVDFFDTYHYLLQNGYTDEVTSFIRNAFSNYGVRPNDDCLLYEDIQYNPQTKKFSAGGYKYGLGDNLNSLYSFESRYKVDEAYTIYMAFADFIDDWNTWLDEEFGAFDNFEG